MFEKTTNGIRNALKSTFIDFLELSSNRVKLIWATFFVWQFFIFYYGIFVPLIREASLIFYAQNGIERPPIDLDSKTYGVQILGILQTAFLGTVISYVGSNLKYYWREKINDNKDFVAPDKKEE